MTFASVRAAAEHAARQGKLTPHQLAAFTALDQALSDAQRQAFTDLWRAEGSPAAPPPEPAWLQPALTIIRFFEGCRLVAYQCPAGIWTIGWGTTRLIDRPVRQGDTISQQLADELLQNKVEIVGREVLKLLPMAKDWSGNRVAALISWAYNVGLNAVEESTLRRRLQDREDPNTVIREELPRWNRANGKVLPGLVTRRAEEVRLFVGASPPTPPLQQQPARLTPASPFSARLTPHIRLGEFALDQEARRFTRQHQVDTAAELAAFLERARSAFGGKPVIITSGYRPPAINRSVGGASGSEHLYDAPGVGAVDWYIEGVDIYKLQDWCIKHWPYSTGKGAPKGFIHSGIRKGRPKVVWVY